jgi:voltage-gated potassium channel
MQDKKNIILFGYGNFGRQLYKNLSVSKHSVKVIGADEDFIEQALSDKVDIININIKRNDDIKTLNINEERDLIYCAMNKTANNLFLVLTLRTMYPKSNIISISNSSENTRKLKYAGANSVIDLYEATSRRVVNMLTKPAVTRALDEIIYNQNSLKMAEIKLPEESIFNDEFIKDIEFKAMGVILIAIIDRELSHELIFIDHRVNHKLDAGDVLVVVGEEENISKLQKRVKGVFS